MEFSSHLHIAQRAVLSARPGVGIDLSLVYSDVSTDILRDMLGTCDDRWYGGESNSARLAACVENVKAQKRRLGTED